MPLVVVRLSFIALFFFSLSMVEHRKCSIVLPSAFYKTP